VKETEATISEPTTIEISDWPRKREESRQDFEISVKPFFDRWNRWRRESAAGKRTRPSEPLKTAA